MFGKVADQGHHTVSCPFEDKWCIVCYYRSCIVFSGCTVYHASPTMQAQCAENHVWLF